MASIKEGEEGSRSLDHSHMSNLPWSDSRDSVHVALTKTHSTIGAFLSMSAEREGGATQPLSHALGAVVLVLWCFPAQPSPVKHPTWTT